ncbi:hypothetical protein RQP46_007005 [Phenoliferia psychrophenolica]
MCLLSLLGAQVSGHSKLCETVLAVAEAQGVHAIPSVGNCEILDTLADYLFSVGLDEDGVRAIRSLDAHRAALLGDATTSDEECS